MYRDISREGLTQNPEYEYDKKAKNRHPFVSSYRDYNHDSTLHDLALVLIQILALNYL